MLPTCNSEFKGWQSHIAVSLRRGGEIKNLICNIYIRLSDVLKLKAENEMADVTTQDALAPTQVPLLAYTW